MSLLPATSHANPTTPFWASASGGGGNAPSLVSATFAKIAYNPPDDGGYVIYTLNCPANAVAGDYVIQANYNYFGGDVQTNTTFGIVSTETGSFINGLINNGTAGNVNYTCLSLSWKYPYDPNEESAPVFEFNVSEANPNGDGAVALTYSVVFYPSA
jgi:hypothetical protein